MRFTFATILACSFLGLAAAGPSRLERDTTCAPAAVQSAVSTCASATTPSVAGECLYATLDAMLQCTQSVVDSALDQLIGVLVGGNGQVTCNATSVAFLQQVCSSVPNATKCVYQAAETALKCTEGAVDGLLGGAVGALVGK